MAVGREGGREGGEGEREEGGGGGSRSRRGVGGENTFLNFFLSSLALSFSTSFFPSNTFSASSNDVILDVDTLDESIFSLR
jgi:hypothetical protein